MNDITLTCHDALFKLFEVTDLDLPSLISAPFRFKAFKIQGTPEGLYRLYRERLLEYLFRKEPHQTSSEHKSKTGRKKTDYPAESSRGEDRTASVVRIRWCMQSASPPGQSLGVI
jgi:hypothetical protein